MALFSYAHFRIGIMQCKFVEVTHWQFTIPAEGS